MKTIKIKDGGKTGAQLKKEGMALKAKGKAMKAEGKKMKVDGMTEGIITRSVRDLGRAILPNGMMMKTGGMVNSNAKIMASKIAKGRVGGTSSAPKSAVPKAKKGGMKKSC